MENENGVTFSGTAVEPSNLYERLYKTAENQLTKSLLHLIDAGGLELVAHICEELSILNRRDFFTIVSQASYSSKEEEEKQRESVPDGIIAVNSVSLVIESKVAKNAISIPQLEAHVRFVKKLGEEKKDGTVVLLYITPDAKAPEALKREKSDILWANWNDVTEILENYCESRPHLDYLYQAFVAHKNKVIDKNEIPADKKVAIVAGSYAEGKARKDKIYHCQMGRNFQDASYIAFYTNKRIAYVYKIVSGPTLYEDGGDRYDLELVLDRSGDPIVNNKLDKNKNPTPFTMGVTRYASIDQLKTARTTSQLENSKKKS